MCRFWKDFLGPRESMDKWENFQKGMAFSRPGDAQGRASVQHRLDWGRVGVR